MDDASVVEMQELMLASALDTNDAGAGKCARHARRHAATQGGMDEPEPRDDAPLGAATELFDSGLDFG